MEIRTNRNPLSAHSGVNFGLLQRDLVRRSVVRHLARPETNAELLHLSPTGVNPFDRSFFNNANPSIAGAFASSLAVSNGNGGVGVSRLILGSPAGRTRTPSGNWSPSPYGHRLSFT